MVGLDFVLVSCISFWNLVWNLYSSRKLKQIFPLPSILEIPGWISLFEQQQCQSVSLPCYFQSLDVLSDKTVNLNCYELSGDIISSPVRAFSYFTLTSLFIGIPLKKPMHQFFAFQWVKLRSFCILAMGSHFTKQLTILCLKMTVKSSL